MSQAARCWCWLRQPLEATEGNRRAGEAHVYGYKDAPVCSGRKCSQCYSLEKWVLIICVKSPWHSTAQWAEDRSRWRNVIRCIWRSERNYLTSHYRQTQRLGRSRAHSPEHYLSWPKAHENHSERTRLSLPFNASFLKLYFNSMKSGLRNIIIKVFIRNI